MRTTLQLILLAGTVTSALATDPYLPWGDDLNGTAVRQGYHIEWQRSAEIGANGEMIISWSDTRFGMRDLFAQKVDASQPGAPAVWSTDDPDHGIVDALIVNDDVIRQEDPVLITNGAGGAWVSWIDFRNDASGDIYVNLLDDGGSGTGSLVYGDGGILLCDDCANGTENMSKSMCIDGAGGAYTVWADNRGTNWDLYVSRVLANGTVDPNFGTDGMVIVDAVGDQQAMSMEHDGAGGAFIVWLDQREASDDNIYIEHVLANGTLVNGDGGQAVVAVPGRQYSPKVTWDGGTGCWVAWVDKRTDNAGDIYVQHYDSQLTPTFAANGIAIAAEPGKDEANPRLAFDGVGATLLMFESNINDPGNTQADVFVQKMNTTDQHLWGAYGAPACLASGQQEQARLSSDEAGGAFIVWQDQRTESYSTIYAQKMNASGTRLWGDNGTVVVDHAELQRDALQPALRNDQDGGLFVAWGDMSRGSLGVFTQHLNAQGQPTFAPEGDDSAWGISGSVAQVKNVATPEGTMVFWVDPRNAGGPHVYMQFLDEVTGNPVLPENGVAVDMSLEGGQNRYDVVSDGSGGAFVVIEAGSDGAQQGFLTRIDSDGQMLWNSSQPVTPAFDPDQSGLYYQQYMKVRRSGDHVVVAWSGVDTTYSMFYAEVSAQAFDFNGTSLWGAQGARVTSTPFIHETFNDIAPDGNGGLYLVWESGDWQDTDVLIQHLDATGNATWADGGLVFGGGVAGNQRKASIAARNGGGVLGIWEDLTADPSNSDLVARAMDANGTSLWETPVDTRAGSQKTARIVNDGYDGAYIAYSDFSNNDNDDIYQRHVLADGSLLWDDGSGSLYVADGSQEDVTGITIPVNGWSAFLVAVAAEETGDTTGYKDLWVHQSNVDRVSGVIQGTEYEGEILNFFHNQREPFLSHDLQGGAYLSWVDMRASGKEDIKDVYTTRVTIDPLSGVDNPEQPVAFTLRPNYPNPFNPSTTLEYQLVRPGQVRMDVFNLAGQRVRSLVNEEQASGSYRIHFDGRNDAGLGLASGIYFARLQAHGQQREQKMVLLK
ncbi:MAG: T9SS type A sorting domain-containing protein [Calditrichaeota bacterium]|nr:T9SS type A sorting domain-containing protein [Calditrichota bacterium]